MSKAQAEFNVDEKSRKGTDGKVFAQHTAAQRSDEKS